MTAQRPTDERGGSAVRGGESDAGGPSDGGSDADGSGDDPRNADIRSGDGADDAPTVPRVDAAECAAALCLPVLAGAVWSAVGSGTVLSGAFAGGAAGWVLARLRLRFRAVRTADGIERRRRPPDRGWATELTDWEYDPRYDRALAAVLAVVGAGAFCAVAVVDASDAVLLRLVVVGHVSLVCALAVYGVSHRD